MQPRTAAPREHLTPEEVEALIIADTITPSAGMEIVDASGNLIEDITPRLHAAEISHENYATIHSSCNLEVQGALDWGAARARLYMTLKGQPRAVSRSVQVGRKSYKDVILEDGPVGYWRLGETEGTTAYDSSGNGHHGSWSGAFDLGASGAISTDSDSGVSLPGGSLGSYMMAGYARGPQGGAPFTLEVWAYPTESGTNDYVLHERSSDNGTPITCINWSGTSWRGFIRDNAGVLEILSIGAGSLDNWQHVALSYDGEVLRGYIDGVLQNDLAIGARTLTFDETLVGGRGGNFSGTVDEPAVYDRALTADEILEHYEVGRDEKRIPIYGTVTEIVPTEARFDLGTYLLSTPTRQMSAQPQMFSVEGYGLLTILDTLAATTYRVPQGMNVVQAIEDILDAHGAGTPHYIEPNDTTLPSDRIWPLDEKTTWLTIVNELLGIIGYRGLWEDWSGRFRSERYRRPATRGIEWTYDTALETTILHDDGEVESDFFDTPNYWKFVRSDPASGGLFVPSSPGVYEVTNEYDGLTSITARGGVRRNAVHFLDVASQEALVSRGDEIVDRDKRLDSTYTLTTDINPLHWHFDVVRIHDDDTGETPKVVSHEWSMDLVTGEMEHVFRKV